MVNTVETISERLLACCRENYQTGCWIWTGSVLPTTGYGVIRFQGRIRNVMRLAAHLYLGLVLDSKLCVYHRYTHCPQTCFNPDHLKICPRSRYWRRHNGKGSRNRSH